MKKFQTVDDYFAEQPKQVRDILAKYRKAIREVASKAEEVISYNMPAFKWKGMLVWYAAFKKHIGLYPKTSAIIYFDEELSGYKTSKGAIQFPIDKPVPITLVKKIVRFRVKENEKLAAAKSKK